MITKYRGLGFDLTGVKDAPTILKKSHLNWPVLEVPASVNGLGKFFAGRASKNSMVIPGWKVLMREDKDEPAGVRPLGIVTDGYKVMQNDAIMKQFTDFAKYGEIEMETAGASDGGRRIFAIGRMKGSFSFEGVSDKQRIDNHERYNAPEYSDKPKDDTTYMKIVMGSGHISGIPLSFDVIAEREICINGVRVVESGGRFTMPHRSTFDERAIARIQSFVEGAHGAFEAFTHRAKQIRKTKTGALIDKIFLAELLQPELFDAQLEHTSEKLRNMEKGESYPLICEMLVENKLKLEEDDFNLQVRQVIAAIENQPGAEFGKGTLWNTVNAVTYFIDHVRGRSNSSFEYAMFGDGAIIKRDAMNLASAYVARLK